MAPSPLWPELQARANGTLQTVIRRPELLRFATDTFMNDLLRVMNSNPDQLIDFAAQPETWRAPAEQPKLPEPVPHLGKKFSLLGRASRRQSQSSTASDAKPQTSEKQNSTPTLKLYQPAHQRFYLVTASLVCQLAGLPDRRVDKSRQESVAFVLRRVRTSSGAAPSGPPETWEEFAMVETPNGYVWEKVVNSQRQTAQTLVPGEELLPMFPLAYQVEADRKRKVFAGNVPVARHEVYSNSAVQNTSNGTTAKTARKIYLQSQVIEPWRNLIELAEKSNTLVDADALQHEAKVFGLTPPEGDRLGEQIKQTREEIQTGSWYALLDLARYIQQYLPNVWQAIDSSNTAGLNAAETNLYVALQELSLQNNLMTELQNSAIQPVKSTMLEALKSVANPQVAQNLEAASDPYDSGQIDPKWPPFLFPLTDPSFPSDALLLNSSGLPISLETFTAIVVRALPVESTAPVPELPLAAQLSNQGKVDNGEGWYVIRCVFQRPECGPLHADVVSEPTQLFQLASFFDPDAPARAIRVTLPADTTPAGLRKYAKNTAFMMSDALCGQLAALKKITFGDLVRSVLPWPFHKSLPVRKGDMKPCPDLAGRVCSLSIPIVTICAMFLLIMIIYILNFIFRWIPFFIVCFKLPRFRSKR